MLTLVDSTCWPYQGMHSNRQDGEMALSACFQSLVHVHAGEPVSLTQSPIIQ